MSTAMRDRLDRVGTVSAVVCGEAVRGRLVPVGWVVLAVLAFLVWAWSASPRWDAFLAAQLFAGNWALLCSGDVLDREFRTGRAPALLLAGVSRSEHWIGTCLAWLVVYAGGAALFSIGFLLVGILQGANLADIAPTLVVPLRFAWLVSAGWVLGIFFPGWSNVAALLILGGAARILAAEAEALGPLAGAVKLLVGGAGESCSAEFVALPGIFVDGLVRGGVFLVLGTFLVRSRRACRRLGRLAAGNRGW